MNVFRKFFFFIFFYLNCDNEKHPINNKIFAPKHIPSTEFEKQFCEKTVKVYEIVKIEIKKQNQVQIDSNVIKHILPRTLKASAEDLPEIILQQLNLRNLPPSKVDVIIDVKSNIDNPKVTVVVFFDDSIIPVESVDQTIFQNPITYTQDQQRLEETIPPGVIGWTLLHEKTDSLNLKMLAQDPINGQKTIYNPETKKIFIKKDEVIPYNNTLNPVKMVFVKYNQEKNGYGILEKNENVPKDLEVSFSNLDPASFLHNISNFLTEFLGAPLSILLPNNSINFNDRIDNSKAFTNSGYCNANVLSTHFFILPNKGGVIPIILVDPGKHYKQGKTTFSVANDVRNKEKIFANLTKKHKKRNEFSVDFFSYKIPKYIQKCAGENNKTRVEFRVGDNNEVYKIYIVERLPDSARFGQVIIDNYQLKNKNPYSMMGISEFSVSTQDIKASAQQKISTALDKNLEKKEKGTGQTNITFFLPDGQAHSILDLMKKINFSLGKNSQIGLKSKSINETTWGTTITNKVFNFHNSLSKNHPMLGMTKDQIFQDYVDQTCGIRSFLPIALPKALSINYEIFKKKHGGLFSTRFDINSFILWADLGSQIWSGEIIKKIKKERQGSWFNYARGIINTTFLANKPCEIEGQQVRIGSFLELCWNIMVKVPLVKIKTNLGIKTKFDAYEGPEEILKRKPTQIFLKFSRKLKLGRLGLRGSVFFLSNFDKEKIKDFSWFKNYYKDSGKKFKFSSFYQISRLKSIKFNGIMTDMIGGNFLQQPDFYIFPQNTTDLYVQKIIKAQGENTHSRFLNLKLAYNKSVLVIKVFGFNICIFYSLFLQTFCDLMKLNLLFEEDRADNNNMLNIGFSIILSTPWFSIEITSVLPFIFPKKRENYRIMSLSFQPKVNQLVEHFNKGLNSSQENAE